MPSDFSISKEELQDLFLSIRDIGIDIKSEWRLNNDLNEELSIILESNIFTDDIKDDIQFGINYLVNEGFKFSNFYVIEKLSLQEAIQFQYEFHQIITYDDINEIEFCNVSTIGIVFIH